MTYLEFRHRIQRELSSHPAGRTWKELRDRLALPYKVPCPEWMKQLEADIGLDRSVKKGNAKIWRLAASR
ncbi:MAG: hypothetical protein AAGK14_02480 [Verrucomicrobiota bacterium]